jgi:hypothetical protein
MRLRTFRGFADPPRPDALKDAVRTLSEGRALTLIKPDGRLAMKIRLRLKRE